MKNQNWESVLEKLKGNCVCEHSNDVMCNSDIFNMGIDECIEALKKMELRRKELDHCCLYHIGSQCDKMIEKLQFWSKGD